MPFGETRTKGLLRRAIVPLRRIYLRPARLQIAFIVVSLLTVCTTTLILSWRRSPPEDYISIISFELAILSIVFAIGAVYRPKSLVVMILKSQSFFSAELKEGIQEVFSCRPDFELQIEQVDEPRDQSFDQRLLSAISKYLFSPRLAAVIIRPSEISARTNELMTTLQRLGVFVVVVDYDIGEEFERLADDHQPLYILSDFRQGGRLVSQAIRSFLCPAESRHVAILALGPENSTTGSARSKSLIWHLLLDGHYRVVIPEIIDEWEPASVCAKLLEQIRQVEADRIVIFAGNDNIADKLASRLQVDPAAGKLIRVIGYDGIRKRNGEWLLESHENCIATIDVKPREQGMRTAQAVLEHALGHFTPRLRVIRIIPEFKEFNGFTLAPSVGSPARAAQCGDPGGELDGGSVIEPLMEPGKAESSVKNVSGA